MSIFEATEIDPKQVVEVARKVISNDPDNFYLENYLNAEIQVTINSLKGGSK